MTRFPKFIQTPILERLSQGTFTSNRRSKTGDMYLPSVHWDERRQTISPLAVTKRCIRYEPSVFENRKTQILRIADSLNAPDKKLIMLSGPPQTGKTSLIRGVIELMGGGNEQLFWYEILPHSDFDEAIQFLMESIYDVCHFLSLQFVPPEAAYPGPPVSMPHLASLQQLKTVLSNVATIPLLIVIDNIHYLVDARQHFNSTPFKELLNFLLAFNNIKVILIGETLPYGDVDPQANEVENIQLSPFSADDFIPLLGHVIEHDAQGDIPTKEAQRLFHFLSTTLSAGSQDTAWMFKALMLLMRQWQAKRAGIFTDLPSPLSDLENRLSAAPNLSLSEHVTRYLYEMAGPEEQELLTILSFVRHPISPAILSTLAMNIQKDKEIKPETLKSLPFRALVKRILPPQWLVARLKENPEAHNDSQFPDSQFLFKSACQNTWMIILHATPQQTLYNQVSGPKKTQIHKMLEEFYLTERNKLPASRLYPVKGKILESEAKYHSKRSASLISFYPLASPYPQSYPISPPLQSSIPYAPERDILPYSKIRIPFDTEFHEIDPILYEKNIEEENTHLTLSSEEQELLLSEKHLPYPAPETSFNLQGWRPVGGGEPDFQNRLQTQFQDFLVIGKDTSVEQQQIQKRLTLAVTQQNTPELGGLLLALAQARAKEGQLEGAGVCLKKALSLRQSLPPLLLAEILVEFGMLCQERYQYNNAVDYYDQAREQLEQKQFADDMPERAMLLGLANEGLGGIAAFRHQPAEALAFFEQALQQSKQYGSQEMQARIFHQIADTLEASSNLKAELNNDELEKALTYYQKAMALYQQLAYRPACAEILFRMGAIHLKQDSFTEAVECFQESLRLQQALQYNKAEQQGFDPELQLKTFEKSAFAYVCLDAIETAESVYKQGLQAATGLENPEGALWQSTFYHKLGHIAEAKNNLTHAINYYKAALSLAQAAELSDQSIALLQKNIEDATHALHHGLP